jgi:hypothetical protein
MSSDKKDLTRIEDLGEFIHELNSENESPSDPPDLPAENEEDVPSFDSSFESSFVSSFDSPPETEQNSFREGGEFESSEDFSSSHFQNESSNLTETPDSPSDTETTIEFESDQFGDNDSAFEEKGEDKSEVFKTDETLSHDEPVGDDLKGDNFLKDSPSWKSEEPLIDKTEKKENNKEPIFETLKEEKTQEEYKAPENFEDLKKFSESSSLTGLASEGNPSFSVLLKNVRYIEDIQDIVIMLKELSLLVDSEEQTKSRLMRGMLLIPRISEYAAIFLAHKLRRFDIDIQVGLSDEIHPPKHQETPETGIVSRQSLYQNQGHSFQFDDAKLELSQIIVASTSQLEGYQIVKYIGVASEHKMVDGHVVEDENSQEVPVHYHELAHRLKAHALKTNSNAVVGLNYQLTPIPGEYGIGGTKYRLTCTGNLVWVNKL